MSLLDELKKEAEQAAKDADYEPTPEEYIEAGEEVIEEQKQAVEKKHRKKTEEKPTVIESVQDDNPQTIKMKMKQSDMDMMRRQMMSRDVPGFGMMFGTDTENLPAMSRHNRLEAAGYATVMSQSAVISGKLKPGETYIEHWINTHLRFLQGIDGQGREDFKIMKQFEQEETKGTGMQG